MAEISYEEAVRRVRKLKRVIPDILSLNLDWSTAAQYLGRMEKEGIVGPTDKAGWREVLPARPRPREANQQSHTYNAFQNSPNILDQNILNKANYQVDYLERQILLLKEEGRKLTAEREEWRLRALEAEKRASSATSGAAEASRYASLKRLLAKELHPDYTSGDRIERVVREEIFKRIWPKIEAIEKSFEK